jgi:hypothetical protein
MKLKKKNLFFGYLGFIHYEHCLMSETCGISIFEIKERKVFLLNWIDIFFIIARHWFKFRKKGRKSFFYDFDEYFFWSGHTGYWFFRMKEKDFFLFNLNRYFSHHRDMRDIDFCFKKKKDFISLKFDRYFFHYGTSGTYNGWLFFIESRSIYIKLFCYPRYKDSVRSVKIVTGRNFVFLFHLYRAGDRQCESIFRLFFVWQTLKDFRNSVEFNKNYLYYCNS